MNSNRIINMKPSCVSITAKYIDIHRMDSKYYDASVMELVSKIEGNFKMDRAEDLFDVITDGDHGVRNYIESGVPFYTAVHVQEEGFEQKTILFIDREYEKSLKRSRIEPGSLLVVKTGVGTGTSCVSSETVQEGNISADVGIFKDPRSDISPYFVSAFMNSPSGRKYILRSSYGSTRNRLTINELKGLKFPLVSPKIQKYIGNKICKAEELREEAKKYMEEAELVFASLVKDDIVYNNNAGNPSLFFNKKTIYSYIEPNKIAERLDAQSFHPEFFQTVNEVRNMGLQTIKLSESIQFHDTGISSPEYGDAGIPIIMTKNIKNSKIGQIENYVVSGSIAEKSILVKGDVLFTTYGGPSIGKVDIFIESQQSTFDYTILRMRFREKFNSYFMLLLLRSKFVQNQVRYMIKGTTGITFVNPKDILNVIIPVFPPDIQREIGFKIQQSHVKMLKAEKLVAEAKQDVEDLIENKFNHSKIIE